MLERDAASGFELVETAVKVLVSGSRGWPFEDGWVIRQRLNELPSDAEVLHGDARGVDRVAHLHWAEALGRPYRRFPADWDRFGKGAGLIRNIEMLDENPDLVLAFWDGNSRGTKHVIDEAQRRGIACEVISP